MSFEVREEVLNVLLAQLLADRGLLSVPETIQAFGKGKKLPDITIADLRGLRVVIEGRIATSGSVRNSLFTDAKKRVLDGISPLALAVLYPKGLKTLESLSTLRKALGKATFRVRVISEHDDGGWTDATVDELTEILRHTYELLISEDVVVRSADELGSAIEEMAAVIAGTPAAPQRLRGLLGIPEEDEE